MRRGPSIGHCRTMSAPRKQRTRDGATSRGLPPAVRDLSHSDGGFLGSVGYRACHALGLARWRGEVFAIVWVALAEEDRDHADDGRALAARGSGSATTSKAAVLIPDDGDEQQRSEHVTFNLPRCRTRFVREVAARSPCCLLISPGRHRSASRSTRRSSAICSMRSGGASTP